MMIARDSELQGLRIVALSRVPYLCQGDGFTSYYALPNALFLLQKEASIV